MKDNSEVWKTKEGMSISVQDCMDALRTGISLISKELEFNDQVKNNPRQKREYEKNVEILEMIKEKYRAAGMMMRQVQRQIPGRKVEKKKSRIILPGDNN